MNAYYQSVEILNSYLGEVRSGSFIWSASDPTLKADETKIRDNNSRANFSCNAKADYRIGWYMGKSRKQQM